jgi:hypothetical protein
MKTGLLILFLWLSAGISLAAMERPGDALDWWALRPLASAEPPSPATLPEAWSQSPIDRFSFAELAKHGLTPSPAAERRAWIRRATYDLLGLPPTPEEVAAFVNDTSALAYERLIDRLLASPHYGERWGRHWLDVIRFGESRGFERNEIIRTAWPFRDYVIRSFNDDKPFDRLVLEHLAGDILGPDDPSVAVGTTFLVAGPYDDVGNQDARQARLIRANTIDDIIGATSGAFLGLTVGCARCHDHKFDPIRAEDYYRFQAIFAGVNHGERVLATARQRLDREELLKPLQARRTTTEEALKTFETSLSKRAESAAQTPREFTLPKVHPHLTEDRFPPVEARFVRLVIESNNRDPRNAGNARIDEFEVWTAGLDSRNAALASQGAKVDGPTRRAEDFADAYATSLVIDGTYGARWISPGAGALTITLPRVERIERIAFSADRQKALPADSGESVFVGEYVVEISLDGREWKRVADSRERPPLNEAFARERRFRAVMTPDDQRRREELQRELNAARAALNAVPPLPQAWVGRFEQPKTPTQLSKGGDPERAGDVVKPASLSTLGRVTAGFELEAGAPESQRRLALARWLVQKDNPLTPRVLANRLWHYHFGTGLVETPSDFGKLGGEPSHPKLLDWLARRLQDHDWRLKPLHREIMLSQTYRQSAAWRADAASVDAGARWLWRFPPRRLGAEEIRDSMLSLAGVLDERMGGPGFQLYRYLQDNVATYQPLDQHGPETYRRAVYHHNARASVVDLMTDYDLPDCSFTTARRASTTSPLQALTLLNHSFTLDMSTALSKRLERDAGPEDGASQVRRAFQLVFNREPTAAELKDALAFAQQRGWPALGRVLFNANEFIYLE